MGRVRLATLTFLLLVWAGGERGLEGGVFQPQEVFTPGQPRSPQDLEAWRRLEQEHLLERKAQLAERYLEEFPEGGFVPYAHQVLAIHAQQEERWEDFFRHAEVALKDLPQDIALLATLSSAYAEQQQPDLAIRRGQKALELLAAEEKSSPSEGDAGEQWRRGRLKSEAHYGVGTGYLFQAYSQGSNRRLLAAAVEHLEQSVAADPSHQYAHFRLGFAYQMQNRLEPAVLEYARASALEGSATALSRQYLEKLYREVHGSDQGMEGLVAEQKRHLEEQLQPR